MPDSSNKVLLVDDDERFLASLRRVLQGSFEIVATKDPLQALKIIEFQGPFSVVISDYRMPLMNGIELFSRISRLDRHVQRIMLTGHAELQMAIDAVNHGKIAAFLTKPTPALSIRSVVLEAVQACKESRAADKPASGGESGQKPAAELAVPLTVKEKEVLSLLARGCSNAEIAAELSITVGTVKSHLNNLFGKLEVNSRSKVIAKGIELGLVKA
jgi:DNA-binding NarL/FixJ family response regulator